MLCSLSSVAQPRLTLCESMECSTPGFPVHHQLPELAQTHVHWVSDDIQPSHPVIPFSSRLQSFSASRSFPVSQFSASGGPSIAASASASVLPMNIQDWFPLGLLTGLLICKSMNCSTPGFPVHHQLPELTQTHVHWVNDAIQPSHPVIPFSSCFQSFPAAGSFQMSQLFTSGGQTIGVSASASVLPMNIQDRFPLGWTGWIILQSKVLSRVFSNTTVQKHQIFGTQHSSQSNSHIHTWLLEKP